MKEASEQSGPIIYEDVGPSKTVIQRWPTARWSTSKTLVWTRAGHHQPNTSICVRQWERLVYTALNAILQKIIQLIRQLPRQDKAVATTADVQTNFQRSADSMMQDITGGYPHRSSTSPITKPLFPSEDKTGPVCSPSHLLPDSNWNAFVSFTDYTTQFLQVPHCDRGWLTRARARSRLVALNVSQMTVHFNAAHWIVWYLSISRRERTKPWCHMVCTQICVE